MSESYIGTDLTVLQDRVRQYFGKIKDAEDPAKSAWNSQVVLWCNSLILRVSYMCAGRLAVDKGVANRFIKHAIAQSKYGRPPGQDEGMSTPAEEIAPVPAKVTSKMLARAQYEKELKELGSAEEEDLEVIDDIDESPSPPAAAPIGGKAKASAAELLADVAKAVSGKRRRPAVDAFDGARRSIVSNGVTDLLSVPRVWR